MSISTSVLMCSSHSAINLKLMLKLSYIVLESEFTDVTDVEQLIAVAMACVSAACVAVMPSYISREVHIRLWCEFDEES